MHLDGKLDPSVLPAPQMILLDYGGTLARESEFSNLRGTEALMRYAVRNEDNISAAEVSTLAESLFYEMDVIRMEHRMEIHEHPFQRFVYESLGIGFDISLLEMETIFWDNAAPCQPMDGIEAFLARTRELGISTGVISNIMFSGAALSARLEKLLPEHRFEFVIATSDYVFRKPSRRIFDLALRKARLSARDCWYIGDTHVPDIQGARGAGIMPIWITDRPDAREIDPDCLIIPGWKKLTAALSCSTMGNE